MFTEFTRVLSRIGSGLDAISIKERRKRGKARLQCEGTPSIGSNVSKDPVCTRHRTTTLKLPDALADRTHQDTEREREAHNTC